MKALSGGNRPRHGDEALGIHAELCSSSNSVCHSRPGFLHRPDAGGTRCRSYSGGGRERRLAQADDAGGDGRAASAGSDARGRARRGQADTGALSFFAIAAGLYLVSAPRCARVAGHGRRSGHPGRFHLSRSHRPACAARSGAAAGGAQKSAGPAAGPRRRAGVVTDLTAANGWSGIALARSGLSAHRHPLCHSALAPAP